MKSSRFSWVFIAFIGIASCTQTTVNQNDTQKEDTDQGSSLSESEGNVLTLAAAANLRFIMADLGEDFEEKSGTDLNIIIASSGKLFSQIANGAPFDVFLSANMKFPQKLFAQKMTTNRPEVYAHGTLIIWSNKNMDFSDGISCLLSDDIKKIAIATDKNAPYGTAALEALKSAKIYSQIKSKLVFGESVSQVNQYVNSSSVDVGLTNKSVVMSKMKDMGVWMDVDTSLYTGIRQGVVITEYGDTHHPQQSQAFLDYLFTESAQEILAKYGYLAP